MLAGPGWRGAAAGRCGQTRRAAQGSRVVQEGGRGLPSVLSRPAHLCSRAMPSSYSNRLMRLSCPTSAALKATRRRLPSASCRSSGSTGAAVCAGHKGGQAPRCNQATWVQRIQCFGVEGLPTTRCRRQQQTGVGAGGTARLGNAVVRAKVGRLAGHGDCLPLGAQLGG